MVKKTKNEKLEQRVQELEEESNKLKRAEASLRDAKKPYQRLLEDLGDNFLIYSHKLDGTLTYAGPGMKSIFGISIEEAIGSDWRKIIKWESGDLELAGENIRNMFSGLKYRRMEMSFRHPDGKQRTVFISPHPIKNSEGSFIGVEGILEDVTERKKVDEALKKAYDELERRVEERTSKLSETVDKLRQAELRYRTVANFTYDWEWWENPDGTFNFISPSSERITGYRAEEFIEDPNLLNQIILPEDRDVWINHQQEVTEEKKFQEIQFRIRRKNGEICWIEHVCQQVVGDQGEFLGFRASNRDISDRKALEAESQGLRAELAHLDRVTTMGAMTAALAHEINQPLTAILSNAQAALRFLRQDKPDLDEVEEALKDITADDKRAAEVIRRLREMIKGQNPLFEAFDLNATIETVIKLVDSEIVIRNVSVTKDLESGLPSLYGDYIQIQQVILNLLLNALDAVNDQPEDARNIVLSTRVEGNDGVTVTITDSGSGIDPDRIEAIFDPFYTMKPKGMGLGLPISRSIVETYGGSLRADNHPDGGATFTIWLPFRKGR